MEHTYKQGLTYDDVLLIPSYTDFTRSGIDLTTRITRERILDIPVVASPMDTVTEHTMAIALGQLGGLGFIHRNLTVEDQAAEVAKVHSADVQVGAAIGSNERFTDRADELVDAGVDILLFDSAHGYFKYLIDAIRIAKKRYASHGVEVIAGNVATADGARALIRAGADGLRVGMGPGAICTTRLVSGMGMPQITALTEVRKRAGKRWWRSEVPFMADGGINYVGDGPKAIAAGASAIMLGRMLAGTTEAPGEVIQLEPHEVPDRFKTILNGATSYLFKEYRGMGSPAAMQRGRDVAAGEEFHGRMATDKLVAEGVEGRVPLECNLAERVTQLTEGFKSGMYYTGSRTIADLQQAQFIRTTHASLRENHPREIFITNSGGIY